MMRLRLIIFMLLLAGTIPSPKSATAEGALIVSVPADKGASGFSYGMAWNYRKADDAKAAALKQCKGNTDASSESKNACTDKAAEIFSKECASVASVNGTSGIGFGISTNEKTAMDQALLNCRLTGGASAQGKCKVLRTECDGIPR